LTSPELTQGACRHNQMTFGLTHAKSESRLLDRSSRTAVGRTAVAVSLLAMLYAKWGGLRTETNKMISSRAGDEITVDIVLPYVSPWFCEDVTWAQAIEPIVSDLILDQHDKIMYEKGKLESCWLHRTEGRVIKDQDYLPTYRSSRADNSISILIDLGLVARTDNNEIKLTARGDKLLRRLMQ